ncbi:MAG: phage protein Gp27 family protein [Novosphingobium sp.]
MGLTPAQAKARRKKNRPSSIDRLDPEIRELIGHLRIDKGWTIDEIRQRLIDMGQEDVPSRSALGRHVRTLEDVSADLRETQIYAEALAKEHGDGNQSQLLDVNMQLLQANMFRLMLASKDGEGIQLGPKDAKDFADALRSIALTRKTDLDVIEKAERRAAEKATTEAAEKATTVARQKGLSKDVVDQIRFAVLGSDQ